MSHPPQPKENDDKTEISSKHVTYNDIASKLLQDKLLLTALELHTELVESGRELKQLKDFFSNPGNFELQTQEVSSRLSRSGSQVTLDSLDLTRYSEDGGGTDERVAVLEFELRKAKETINALRNNLTVATESETSSPSKGSLRNVSVGGIKPHEQRALNFLINEYLLLHGYKLTSITFADENESQDFDDWDDVGLNISKPPELLALYREGLKQTWQDNTCVSTQTGNTDPAKEIVKTMARAKELEDVKEKAYSLELENSKLNYSNLKLQEELKQFSSQLLSSGDNETLSQVPNVEDGGAKGTAGSESPERFEIIDKNMPVFKEDNISNSSFNASDWMNLSIPVDSRDCDSNEESKPTDVGVYTSKESFIKEVFSLCYVNAPSKIENEVLGDVVNEDITSEKFVRVVSSSLLRIIPNIILNKREEAIPLLVSTVHLNPKASERDKLLQQLFNLKKKPSESERNMILTGLIGIAKCSGESLVENEILPQCWLQLTHKHIERRLLVAEACIALMVYISEPIRNSLCLSMLQQMLEDKEETVRETVVRALSILAALCNDRDKYYQIEQLAFNTLNDSSKGVVNLNIQILFPVLGKWTLNEGDELFCIRILSLFGLLFPGFLTSSLLKKLLHKLNCYIKDTESPSRINMSSDKILRVISVLENLLPFLLMVVASHENIISNIEKDMAVELRPELKTLCTTLTNPEKFFKSEVNCGMILYEFDKYVSDNPNMSWEEMDWIVDVMLPDLLNNLHHIEITQQSLLQSFMNLLSRICIVFGRSFARYKIRPILQNKIQNLEQVISSFNQFCPSLNIVPVYLIVLTYCGDLEELSTVLTKFLCALPLCGSPLDCLEITVRRLCESGMQETVVDCLWTGVVHQRPLVRAAAATLFSGIAGMCSNELLKTKVTAALVTLASDNDILVRTATIPALGNLITDCTVKEIHDKAYMQLQTYLSDSNLRENHTLLRQLVVTLGNIVNSCTPSFRNEVILPQLTTLSSFMSQMTNQTRKVDMALALLEAFTNVVYSPLNKQSISSVVVPGLRCLEAVVMDNQTLQVHRETVSSMIKECDNKTDVPASVDRNQTLNQGVEEMRQKVSKIFNKPTISKPNSLPNLQGIFKKK
ncbi:hypothetical protein NQ315_006175 [Exocentrus adspersus]|uniref:LisH domain-containing protein n=1 Tax=Exocentrus adspersus TaxID=1586481 RepID=A0AAV8VZ69_9CUCU|nr:hypothetical protein NQ315_006175 [Exocentrus adspersus]